MSMTAVVMLENGDDADDGYDADDDDDRVCVVLMFLMHGTDMVSYLPSADPRTKDNEQRSPSRIR